MLCPPLGLLTAVSYEVEGTILGGWQGGEGFLDLPCHQQMDSPIGRLEHATKAPGRPLGRGPARQFFQGFPARIQGLHDHNPTQDEAMATFPHAGHPSKQERDKQGHRGDGDHSLQHRDKSVVTRDPAVRVTILSHYPLSPDFEGVIRDGCRF
jgi:hypothetical protein